MTTPTLDAFVPRIVLPADLSPAERIEVVRAAIIYLARRDRHDPQPELAFIGFKVVAVTALCCAAGLTAPEANEIADQVWMNVQKENHA